MEKIRLLCLTCLMAALLGLNPGVASAFDGDDGGFDDGGFDDGGDGGDDDGQDHDGDGHHDEDGHHDGDGHHGGHGHHHHDQVIVHHHGGYGWGWPGFGPGFGFGAFGYPFPYYAYPPLAAQPSPPPVYIQQQNAAQPASGSQANYWHYCRAAEGYYPEIKECPDGWQQVAPQPPSEPSAPVADDQG